MVGEVVFIQLQLVELRVVEIKVVVGIVVQNRRVRGIEHGAVGLYQSFTRETIGLAVVLLYGDVEVANNAFVLPKLQVGPLSVVHKLLDGLLQVVEHSRLGGLHLTGVHGDFRSQLLCERATANHQ